MITREQYLEALDIVETYHQQLRQNDSINPILTPISRWNKFNICGQRLRNILYGIEAIESYPYKEKYVENIDIAEMKKIYLCGKKTIAEFVELRGF